MNCPNCNSKMSCGCQRRVASDGKQVCSTCINNYEQKVKKAKEETDLTNANYKPPSS